MPAAQMVSAAIERALNQLIKLDPDAKKQLTKLTGKQLKVKVKEVPWPLVFAFSEQIDVQVAEQNQDPDAQHAVNCAIELELSSLERLRDNSQITALIREDALSLEGDIEVAQQFSLLLKNIDIDWEEQLARQTSDVFAHSLFSAGKQILSHSRKTASLLFDNVREAAIEEKQIAAHPLAVEDFCQQVNEIRSGCERLEARLRLLEKAREVE